MSRYIDADELKELIIAERDKIPRTVPAASYELEKEKPYNHGNSMRGGIRIALRCMEQCPTINSEDLRPKGKWVYDIENDTWYCSKCGEENCYAYSKELKRFTDNYCPVCGSDNRNTIAKMEG